MRKDPTATNNLSEDLQSANNAMDLFNSYLNAPMSKLDADEYSAADIDGVTESLAGSGNLNFLMMQASQIDGSMLATDDSLYMPFGAPPMLAALPEFSGQSNLRGMGNTAFERPASIGENILQASDSLPSGVTSIAGNLSASSMMASSTAQNPLTESAYFSDSVSSVSGSSNTSSTQNSSSTTTTTINNTTNETTVINKNEFINIEDVTNILETVSNIYNNTTETVTNITEDVTNIVNNTVNNVTDILNNTVNNVTDIVNNTLNNVTDIVTNIFDGTPLPDLGPIGIDLDATLTDITTLNLDIIGLGGVTNVLHETLDLGGILTPLAPITGTLLSGVSLPAIIDPFDPDTSVGDTDLHVGLDLQSLNLPFPDIALNIPLDPVEALLGDIDVSLDLTEQLLNILPLGGNDADTDLSLALTPPDILAPVLNPVLDLVDAVDSPLINPVEDLVGDIDIGGTLGLGLLGISDTDGPGMADTDIALPIDLDLVNHDILNEAIEIGLDPVENLVGDIDLDLSIAGDFLGQAADNLLDNLDGGTGTDNLLSGIGDLASSIVDETLNGLSSVIEVPELVSGLGIDLLAPDANETTDTDLSIDLAFIDPVEVNLDFVESLTGDIDLNVDLENVGGIAMDALQGTIDGALGLLGGGLSGPSVTDGLSGLLGGGGGVPDIISGWTETILPDVSGALGGGLAGDLLGGAGAFLPDPIIPLPVPALPAPVGGGHHGGLLGGLFG